jgi:hypothetical protein
VSAVTHAASSGGGGGGGNNQNTSESGRVRRERSSRELQK